jgi:8-oxo-dGTP pyrophosphatase MutT (NUDIX family)
MGRRDYYDDPEAPKPNSIVPAVTAVVEDDQGRVLLIHRVDNGRWALPGGQVEVGERIADTVVREVHEETGIDVEVVGLAGIYSDPKHVIAYDDGEVRQQFALSFQARPIGGSLRGSDEGSEVRWLFPSELDQLDIHPSMRLRIEHGLHRPATAPHIG